MSVDEVLNSSTVKIDFSLAPGPTQFWEVQHENCAELEQLRGAMTDEILSTTRFDVNWRSPESTVVIVNFWGVAGSSNGKSISYIWSSHELPAHALFWWRVFDRYQPDETYGR